MDGAHSERMKALWNGHLSAAQARCGADLCHVRRALWTLARESRVLAAGTGGGLLRGEGEPIAFRLATVRSAQFLYVRPSEGAVCAISRFSAVCVRERRAPR